MHIVRVGNVPMMNQQALASTKPMVMATSAGSFLASAAIGTVTRMMVQASTVSMISKRSNLSTSRT